MSGWTIPCTPRIRSLGVRLSCAETVEKSWLGQFDRSHGHCVDRLISLGGHVLLDTSTSRLGFVSIVNVKVSIRNAGLMHFARVSRQPWSHKVAQSHPPDE